MDYSIAIIFVLTFKVHLWIQTRGLHRPELEVGNFPFAGPAQPIGKITFHLPAHWKNHFSSSGPGTALESDPGSCRPLPQPFMRFCA